MILETKQPHFGKAKLFSDPLHSLRYVQEIMNNRFKMHAIWEGETVSHSM